MADLFILPSPSETQGLVLVEAMMGGLPCIGINRGGPTEIVAHGETGFLVSLDPYELAAATDKLLASPELRREMGGKGRDRSSKFSADAMACSILRIYEELSHARPKRRLFLT